jgi:predicted PurR-regulated permease PerM
MKKIKAFFPPPLVALLLYTGWILLLIFCLKYLTLVAAPLFFSLVIAYLFNPVVTYLEQKTPLSRFLLSGILMIFLVLVLIFVIVSLLPYVIDQVKNAAEKFPALLTTFSQKVRVVSDYLTRNFSEYIGPVDIMGKIEEMLSLLLTDLSRLLSGVFTSLYSVLVLLLYLVFIPLFSYYFLKDYYKIKNTLFELVPNRFRQTFIDKTGQLNRIVFSFVRGQAIVVLILAILYSVGLSLIGLPFAILIGIFAGLGDLIPYMGTILGFLVSLIIGFAHFQSIEKILLIVLIFAVVKGSENWFFYPKIVGGEVGLHFVWVLMSIIIFGQLFGFWGLLLAIPSSAGFKIFIGDLLDYYKKSGYYLKQ